MSALGAYMHGNIFFILFEEAEHSLHDYLNGKGPRFDSAELWKQFEGVASALACLHQLVPSGRLAYHRDLKPANILIVNGVMKISDFGLLEFKPVRSSEASTSSGIISNIRHDYGPPPGPRYSQKSDVWSLGTIASEIAVSDIQGVKAIEEYRKDRIRDTEDGTSQGSKTFYLANSVKKSVLDRHQQLEALVKPLHPSTKAKAKALSEWQVRFYTPGFFLLLKRMFDLTHTSEEVVNQLMTLTRPRLDIWEEQVSGRLLRWSPQNSCQL
jgi:serine/threonine protein kinase